MYHKIISIYIILLLTISTSQQAVKKKMHARAGDEFGTIPLMVLTDPGIFVAVIIIYLDAE